MSGDWLNDEKARRWFAESGPKRLLFSFRFWRKQFPLMFILVSFMGVIYYLGPLTYPQSKISALLSALIQVSIPWAFLVAAKGMARIHIEHAIVREIEARATAKLEQMKRGDTITVAIVEQDILPNNKTYPAPAMMRLFQNMCFRAKDLDFGTNGGVDSYREETAKTLFDLNNIKDIALRAGILGTFIGLLFALVNLGEVLGLNSSTGPALDPTMLINYLHIAFSTSVAGLEAAVMVGFLLIVVGRGHEKYTRDMDTALATMTSVLRRSLPDEIIVAELGKVGEVISKISREIYEHTGSLNKNLEEVQKVIQQQNTQITEGLQQIPEVGRVIEVLLQELHNMYTTHVAQTEKNYTEGLTSAKEFMESYMTEMGRMQKSFVQDIRTMVDAESFQTITKQIQSTVVDAAQNLGTTFGVALAPVSQELVELKISNQKLNENLPGLCQKAEELSQHLKSISFEDMAESMKTSFVKSGGAVTHDLKKSLESILSDIKGIRENTQGATPQAWRGVLVYAVIIIVVLAGISLR